MGKAVERFRRQDGDGGTAGDGGADVLLRPAAGVYTYEGTGVEKLSVLSTHLRWGPRLPATVVRKEGGCWNLRVEYSTKHWQSWTYCLGDAGLDEDGGSSFQSFDFVAFKVDDHIVFHCKPRNHTIKVEADPGDSWKSSCSGASEQRGTHVTSSGTDTFLGVENVEVGDESVRAYHYLSERTMSGDQSGTEHTDTWFALSDGMPVKTERVVKAKSPSPIGDVTYTERGTYTLTSLRPRR